MIKKTLKNIQSQLQVLNSYHNMVLPLLILTSIICISFFIQDDGDYYWIYESGKKIIEDGCLPYTDWMSMHSGLQIILQQWPVCIITYLIASSTGKIGLFILVLLLCVAIVIVLYKIVVETCNNYIVAFFIPLISIILIAYLYANVRPTIYTLLLISLMFLFIRRYEKTRHISNLIIITILSLLQSNFHSTFWSVFIFCYCIYAAYDFIQSKDKKLLLFSITIIAIGFINPYGIKALLHAFYTINYNDVYSGISELAPLHGFVYVCGYLLLPVMLLMLRIRNLKRLDSLIIYIIITLLMIAKIRMVVLSIIAFVPLIADTYSTSSVNNITEQTIDKKRIRVAYVLLSFTAIISIISGINRFVKPFNNNYSNDISIAFKNNDVTGKTVFVSQFSVGQYLYHFNGMRPFVDGRLETFIKNMNNKEDILPYYKDMLNEKISIQEAIDKYDFDYLVFIKHYPLYYNILNNPLQNYHTYMNSNGFLILEKDDE